MLHINFRFGRKETKYFTALLYFSILLSKASVEQMIRAALELKLGKSTFQKFIDEHGTSLFYVNKL